MGHTQSQRWKKNLFPDVQKEKKKKGIRDSLLFPRIIGSCRSAEVDQGHDCGVLVLQAAHVSVTQRVIVFDDAVAAELAVAKQAKERRVGENLVEGVGLHVGLVVVVLAPSHTRKHEAQGVSLRDFGRF